MEMKTLRLILILFFIQNSMFSQNIFLNADFEIDSVCPTNTDQFNKLIGWKKAIESPDYYNCSFTNFPVGLNYGGAYSGSGFVALIIGGSLNGTAEAFGQVLTQPLKPDTSYQFKFGAKRTTKGVYANSCAGVAIYGFKDAAPIYSIGIHASQIDGAQLLGITPIISDTIWQQQVLYLNPIDTIKFVMITLEKKPSCNEYVFLDAVNLKNANSIVAGVGVIDREQSSKIYPTFGTGEVIISSVSTIEKVVVFNSIGQKTGEYMPTERELKIQIKESGIYYTQVTVKGKTEMAKLIISK